MKTIKDQAENSAAHNRGRLWRDRTCRFGTGGRLYDLWWYPSNPSAEVEQIIERSNPQAQPAEEPETEEELAAEGEGEEGAVPKKMPRLSPDEPVFLTTYYEFPGNLTTNLRGSRKFIHSVSPFPPNMMIP